MKYHKASFWSRLFACFIDGTIFALPSSILEVVYGESFGFAPALIFYTYCILMEANFQKTLGKHMMGLKVVKTNGRKPNLANCFWRNIGKYISAIPYGYGFLRVLAPHHIQTIHDELARCLVVSE